MALRKILTLISLFFPIQVSALSWEDAIAATEAKSNELWRLADERGLESHHLGTFYNEYHADEHRCSILGRMLGKADIVESIEKSTEVDVSTADGKQTALAALSLDNWIYIAESLLKSSEARRVREWNLDCVGQMDIPNSAYITETNSSTFYDVEGEVLRVMGDVEPGFADKLRSALAENSKVTTIALGSGGGSVGEALNAGYLIRAKGLKTTLWNNCYSACTIVFIGGTERTIWSPYPDLSFHQASRGGAPIPPDDDVYGYIAQYVSAMGVDMEAFMNLMLSAPPSSFTTPAPGNLCAPRIATWVQRLCW